MALSINNTSTTWLENHPRIAGALAGGSAAFRYIVTGGWVVDLVRWLVDTGGNIAESAFVLATVYVTINTVAHLLVSWLLPDGVIASLNQISVIAFSVLPELIVVAAMAVTLDHWRVVRATGRADAWVWAIAYTLPTAVFLGMTVYTITSFVSFEVANTVVTHIVNGKAVTTEVTASPQATGAILVTRCLAGWGYGMVQMLWVKLGKKGYSSLLATLQGERSALGVVVADRDQSINELAAKVTSLEQQLEQQGKELLDARLQIATAKVTRVKSDDSDQSISEQQEQVTNSKVTSLGDSVQRSKLKKHIRGLVLNGDKLNYKQIASDTGISYNTVRRHASAIVDEISQERSA